MTASGFAYDFNTKGFGSLSFGVQVYPGLQQLLKTNPNFLRDLDDLTLASLKFDFHIFAAITPMTSAEYVTYQTQRADDLRSKILADTAAPQQLVVAVGDKTGFETFYLQALVQAGILRPEDAPPQARTDAPFDSNLAVMVAGLLGGEGGSELIANTDLHPFFALVRKWANDTPDAVGWIWRARPPPNTTRVCRVRPVSRRSSCMWEFRVISLPHWVTTAPAAPLRRDRPQLCPRTRPCKLC